MLTLLPFLPTLLFSIFVLFFIAFAALSPKGSVVLINRLFTIFVWLGLLAKCLFVVGKYGVFHNSPDAVSGLWITPELLAQLPTRLSTVVKPFSTTVLTARRGRQKRLHTESAIGLQMCLVPLPCRRFLAFADAWLKASRVSARKLLGMSGNTPKEERYCLRTKKTRSSVRFWLLLLNFRI